MRGIQWWAAGIAALCCAELALAQSPAIFTCVDGKGRRLTADRPILECIDREQKELNPSGTTRRAVGPSLTAHEQSAEEDKARRLALEQQRALDEKRRDRALLSRYPNKEAHERELGLALQRVQDVIVAVSRTSVDLATQRAELAAEADLYKGDPSRRPQRLVRMIDDNEQMQLAQKRFVDEQQLEKKRVAARFDDERQRLQNLWARRDAPVTTVATGTAAGPASLAATPVVATPAASPPARGKN